MAVQAPLFSPSLEQHGLLPISTHSLSFSLSSKLKLKLKRSPPGPFNSSLRQEKNAPPVKEKDLLHSYASTQLHFFYLIKPFVRQQLYQLINYIYFLSTVDCY